MTLRMIVSWFSLVIVALGGLADLYIIFIYYKTVRRFINLLNDKDTQKTIKVIKKIFFYVMGVLLLIRWGFNQALMIMWLKLISSPISEAKAIDYIQNWVGGALVYFDYNSDFISSYIGMMIIYIYNSFGKQKSLINSSVVVTSFQDNSKNSSTQNVDLLSSAERDRESEDSEKISNNSKLLFS